MAPSREPHRERGDDIVVDGKEMGHYDVVSAKRSFVQRLNVASSTWRVDGAPESDQPEERTMYTMAKKFVASFS